MSTALWRDVMTAAVTDLTAPHQSCRAMGMPNTLENRETIRKMAYEWMAAEAYGHATFLWVCEMLDLNPNAVRKAHGIKAETISGRRP